MPRGRVRTPIAERFWSKVARRGPTDCWEWTGARNRGYGQLYDPDLGRPEKAHRVSWQLHYGPIPNDLQICHHCDNPPCVNPRHLFLGSAEDNVKDCIRKGRADFLRHHPRQKVLDTPSRNSAYA